MGSSTGTFTDAGSATVPSTSGSDALIAVDLNGDSLPDLVVGNTDGTLTPLINNGSGFTTGTSVTLPRRFNRTRRRRL